MRRSNWLAGLVVGVTGGALFWLFPTLGVVVLASFGLLAIRRPDRSFGVSGLLIGVGASWLGVLVRAIVACDRFDAAPNQACASPDMTPWIIVCVGFLVAGVGLLIVGLRRAR